MAMTDLIYYRRGEWAGACGFGQTTMLVLVGTVKCKAKICF